MSPIRKLNVKLVLGVVVLSIHGLASAVMSAGSAGLRTESRAELAKSRREPTFEERLLARRAIEEIYWRPRCRDRLLGQRLSMITV